MRKTLLFQVCLAALFFQLSGFAFGQSITQTLRGEVRDASNFTPVSGVRVNLRATTAADSFATKTLEKGKFQIENVPVGRYIVRFSKEGYEHYIISDYKIDAGKEAILEISFQPTVYEGGEVLITGQNEREFDRPSVHLLKVEDTKKLAASFFDPARVAASFSGVVQTDNQSNNLIVRGNSPNGIRWRLEGVDIANPNHLPNAGTFSDRISLSGGGQIILSTQLLANSVFTKGAFSAQYGDALSGVFDMRLRAGNNEQNEFTLQAGLIGIDLAAEGPISKKQGSSFLVNYRYSFTGLLSTMGVTFGGEDIRFQDLAFNLSFPTENAGYFTVFGMGGLSSNVFTGARVDTAIQEGKDRFDIDFRSATGTVGMTHRISLGKKTSLRSVLAASSISSTRNGEFIEDLQAPPRLVEEDQLTQTIVSLSSILSHQFNEKLYLKGGFYLTHQENELLNTFSPLEEDTLIIRASNNGNTQLVQPFATVNFRPSSWLSMDLGLHAQYLTLNGSFALEPRLNFHFAFSNRHHLSLAYGLHSQQQLPQVYFTRLNQGGESIFPNRDLGFTRAHHLIMSYQFRYSEKLSFRLEPYYQELFNVPVVPDLNRPISTLNLIEGIIRDSLVNAGRGRNYGVEFSANRYLSDRFYTIISGSLYESEYTGFDSVWRDTRFNGNYAVAISLGYEYDRITRKGKNKVFGANLRIIQAGGLLLQPVDSLASLEQQRTVYDTSQGFTERLQDQFRVDVGISFKRNKSKTTRTFSIDIQNLTNNQPVAFRVFDIAEQQVVDRLRFGLFPVASYRLEF